jgi:hypothetical protein
MSSEHLASAKNHLKGDLGGSWNILDGASAQYTDLGIARKFGGSAAAYSLRDIGAVGKRVVKVRRDVDGDGTDKEEDFSASQVQSGALEDFVNGKLENVLPADVSTAAAAYSLRKVKADYTDDAVRIRRSSDDAEVNVAFDSDNKVSTSSSISVVSGTVSGTTLGDFISGTDAFVHTWYDQAGSNDATQTTSANQPKIAESGTLLADGIDFDGSSSFLDSTSALGATATVGAFIVHKPDTTDANRYLIDNRDASNDGMRIMQREESSGNYRVSMDTTEVNSASGSVTTNETLLTAIQSSTALTLFKNSASQATAADDAISVTAAFRIGANRVSLGTYFDGTMKEIILFTSDQTDNRFKIESNINNHYSLYNVNGNGFVETWYDQSGNGNDATQGTATKQPLIVNSGSIITETQGKPAIGFQQTDTSFGNQEFFNTTSNVSVQAMYATLSIKDTNDDEQTVVGHGSDNNKFIAILKQAASPSSAPRVRETSTDLKYSAPSGEELDTGIVFSYNRNASNNNVVRINNVNSAITSGTDTNLNTDIVIQMVGARTNGLDSWRGKMQEVILFDRDTEDDRTDLQNDMANFYNITLS